MKKNRWKQHSAKWQETFSISRRMATRTFHNIWSWWLEDWKPFTRSWRVNWDCLGPIITAKEDKTWVRTASQCQAWRAGTHWSKIWGWRLSELGEQEQPGWGPSHGGSGSITARNKLDVQPTGTSARRFLCASRLEPEPRHKWACLGTAGKTTVMGSWRGAGRTKGGVPAPEAAPLGCHRPPGLSVLWGQDIPQQ